MYSRNNAKRDFVILYYNGWYRDFVCFVWFDCLLKQRSCIDVLQGREKSPTAVLVSEVKVSLNLNK